LDTPSRPKNKSRGSAGASAIEEDILEQLEEQNPLPWELNWELQLEMARWLPSRASDLPRMKPSDLDRGCEMAVWEVRNWLPVRTLAAAFDRQGVVELMASRETGEKVAVKRMPRELVCLSPAEFNQSFPKQIERPWVDLGIIKHLTDLGFPWICNLLGVFADFRQVYFMTSFADRDDLFTWVQTDTSFPGPSREAAMRPLVSQISMAVCWLHNLGIAHRDLSLENVLLADSGAKGLQVKIIDFAMATLSRKAFREVRGKKSYRAPEMYSHHADYDTFLADNFAVGVMMYCMAVHSYPWEHTSPGKDASFEYAWIHGLQDFVRMTRLPSTQRYLADVFSESLVDLLCGLLDFAPATRYSVGEACFQRGRLSSVRSKTSLPNAGPDVNPASDASTTDSFGGNSEDLHEGMPANREANNLDHLSISRGQQSPARASIWDCPWILVRDSIPCG